MNKLSPLNFVTRFNHQSYDGSTSANKVRANNRKLIYSKYRRSRAFKPANDDSSTSCTFSHDNQCLLVGSDSGKIYIFNKHNGDLTAQKEIHEGDVISLVPHKSGELLLTTGCSPSNDFQCALWNIKNNFENQFNVMGCYEAGFSHAQDKVLGTLETSAQLYDLNTGQAIHEYKPKTSSFYENNRAELDPYDELLLTDGVLFDVRSGKEVYRFKEIKSYHMNGKFHTNRLEIIRSSEIWDLRTFHLLQTLDCSELWDAIFNNNGDVIFAFHLIDYRQFSVIDATDYSSIATIDMRHTVASFAINPTDTQIAVPNGSIDLYDIGMVRHEEEGSDEDDDDDEDDVNDDNDENNEEYPILYL